VKACRNEGAETGGQGRAFGIEDVRPWTESVNGAELLADIAAAIKHYLALPEGAAEIVAVWVLHTHCFDCFMISPRLAITSPEKGCGKTTLLDVLREFVARPLPTSNATPAVIFRIVEMKRPTILIDEADSFLGDSNALRGVLNSGHRKGGQVVRTVGDEHEPRMFSTWAPAAIALIGKLPDTLEDRSVTCSMRRRKPSERVESFRSDRANHLHVLARKMARWVADRP
jgi:putative DNA primase/helicase